MKPSPTHPFQRTEPAAELAAGFDASYRLLAGRINELTEELRSAREERRRQLEEKERLAGRLQSLLVALPAGIVVLDAGGRVQEANPAALELLGEPLVGEPWREIVGRAFAMDSLSDDLILRDGRRVTLSTRPLGSPPGQLIQLQDVTESRRLHQRVDHFRRLADMGRMAATLAHQIRTPLASALLYVSQLRRSGLPEEKRTAFAGKAADRLKDLERLITDVLAFARGEEAGRESTSACALIREAVATGEGELGRSGVQVVLPVAEDVSLTVNPTLITTALQNLVRNAAEAMPEGGRIVVSLSAPDDGAVEIRVSDNGPGIPPEARERIFEPFETSRSAGTGLGLAVVRAVARAHGGEAWAESEPGHGSTFILRLPVDMNAGHEEAALFESAGA